jgi:hypothetical protein
MTDSSSLISDVDLDQIGIVVHDLHAVTQELTRMFGIGPFRIFEWPLDGIDPKATYHGQSGNFRLLLAFATAGKTQIEIIQPLEGENVFSDFLRERGPGLHHIRLNIPDFEGGVAALIGAGIENISSGTGVHHGSKWAYFDTSHLLGGALVELRTRLEGVNGEGQWVQSNPPENSSKE